VNLTGEKAVLTDVAEPASPPSRRIGLYLTALFFPVFVVVSYSGVIGSELGLLSVLISTGLYFAAIYFFYGLAELAVEGRTYLLWASAAAALVLGVLTNGLDRVWPLLTGGSMFLFGGVLVGRLCARGRRPATAYLLGAFAVALFFTAQFAGLWGFLMDQARDALTQWLPQLESAYRSAGRSPEAIQDDLAEFQRVGAVLIRLIPALTILGALVEFSLGFLLFSYVVDRRYPWLKFRAPFHSLRVPFALTPVMAVTILARLLAGDQVRLAADNLLAILALYYSVAGLALIEYYMKRFALSTWLRVGFYVLLTMTPLMQPRPLTALAVFGTLMLLGFIDSFTDWRRERPEAAVS